MPDFELAIADKNISSWSLRPWLLMRTAGIPFVERVILLGRPTTADEIRAYSPSGWIPCLLVDGRPIWDSLAICEYIAEEFPEKRLWPTDRWAKATARSVTAEMHSGFRSFPTELRMNTTSHLPTPPLENKLKTDIGRVLRLWRDCRQEFGRGGPFLFGEFSVADAFFAPVVSRFTTYDIPAGDTEKAYMDAIWQLPGMKEWQRAAEIEIVG